MRRGDRPGEERRVSGVGVWSGGGNTRDDDLSGDGVDRELVFWVGLLERSVWDAVASLCGHCEREEKRRGWGCRCRCPRLFIRATPMMISIGRTLISINDDDIY